MTQVFEFASFTVHDGHERALLDERPAMVDALRRAFSGLISAWLTQRDDGSWLDVILWTSRREAEHASRHVTEVPEAAAWFTHISESSGIEHLAVVSPDAGLGASDDQRGQQQGHSRACTVQDEQPR